MYPYENSYDSPVHVPTPYKLDAMGRTWRCDTFWSSAWLWREQEACQTSCQRFACIPAQIVWCEGTLGGVYDGYTAALCAGRMRGQSVPTPASLRLRAALILRAT